MAKKTPYQQVVEHFNGAKPLADALGISRTAVYLWNGKIPPLRAYEIEVITSGKFKAADILARQSKSPRAAVSA